MAAPPPLPDPSAARIDTVCSTAREGRRAARMLAEWAQPFEFGEPELQVLWQLRAEVTTGIDQKTLAHCLALSPAQVSVTVERVRQRGLVELCDGRDRRRNVWRLSNAGRQLLAAVVRHVVELEREDALADTTRTPACVRREAAA